VLLVLFVIFVPRGLSHFAGCKRGLSWDLLRSFAGLSWRSAIVDDPIISQVNVRSLRKAPCKIEEM